MYWYIILGIILIVVGCCCYLRVVKVKNAKVFSCDYDLYFEPKNPISNPEELAKEILRHFEEENVLVTILDKSMEPRILLNNEEYICRLGEPFRIWNPIKYPINSFSGRFFGYKWVYIYKI